VSQFLTPGGVTFVGLNGNSRQYWNPDYHDFMPRIGFAYQVNNRIVMRGGFGLFYGLMGSDYTNASQPGFSAATNVVPSLNSGVSYVAALENPLPNGITRPVGTSAGLATLVGGSPGFFNPNGQRSYTERWNYSVQFQPDAHSVLEIGYMGSAGEDLSVTRNVNTIPRQYLSTLPTRDQPVINLLSSVVSNPFVGIPAFAGTSLYSTKTTALSQLILPYPEFTALNETFPIGSSSFHALTARFEHRLANGLQAQANYTFSKTMESTDFLNPTDTHLEHAISSLDRPHRVVLSMIYQLPFGKGRHFGLKGFKNQIAGGWDMDLIYNFQSGPPLAFGDVIFACSSYNQLALPNRSLQEWFNTGCFQRSSALQLANNIRTFPTELAAVRGDGIDVLDFSIHKDFPIWERFTMQLSGMAEGLTNHANFSPPNLVPSNTLFGSVTATQTGQEERRVFVTLKLMF